MTNVLFPSGPRTRGNARPTSWEASHLTQPLVQMKQADIGPFSFTPTAGAPDLSINELKTHLSHSDHWANSSVPTTSSCSHTVCPQGDQIAPAGTGKWCLGRRAGYGNLADPEQQWPWSHRQGGTPRPSGNPTGIQNTTMGRWCEPPRGYQYPQPAGGTLRTVIKGQLDSRLVAATAQIFSSQHAA